MLYSVLLLYEYLTFTNHDFTTYRENIATSELSGAMCFSRILVSYFDSHSFLSLQITYFFKCKYVLGFVLELKYI